MKYSYEVEVYSSGNQKNQRGVFSVEYVGRKMKRRSELGLKYSYSLLAAPCSFIAS